MTKPTVHVPDAGYVDPGLTDIIAPTAEAIHDAMLAFQRRHFYAPKKVVITQTMANRLMRELKSIGKAGRALAENVARTKHYMGAEVEVGTKFRVMG